MNVTHCDHFMRYYGYLKTALLSTFMCVVVHMGASTAVSASGTGKAMVAKPTHDILKGLDTYTEQFNAFRSPHQWVSLLTKFTGENDKQFLRRTIMTLGLGRLGDVQKTSWGNNQLTLTMPITAVASQAKLREGRGVRGIWAMVAPGELAPSLLLKRLPRFLPQCQGYFRGAIYPAMIYKTALSIAADYAPLPTALFLAQLSAQLSVQLSDQAAVNQAERLTLTNILGDQARTVEFFVRQTEGEPASLWLEFSVAKPKQLFRLVVDLVALYTLQMSAIPSTSNPSNPLKVKSFSVPKHVAIPHMFWEQKQVFLMRYGKRLWLTNTRSRPSKQKGEKNWQRATLRQQRRLPNCRPKRLLLSSRSGNRLKNDFIKSSVQIDAATLFAVGVFQQPAEKSPVIRWQAHMISAAHSAKADTDKKENQAKQKASKFTRVQLKIVAQPQ